MGKAVEIVDEHGTVHTYPVRTAEELTVSEWVRMTIPPISITEQDELLATYQMLERYLGCPASLLRRIPIKDVAPLIKALEDACASMAIARKDEKVPTHITHEGVTYAVPQNPAEELSLGQYADIMARLDKVTYQDEGLAVVLAVMLQPPGGYDAAGLQERIEAMGRMPAVDAITLAAFFFAGSEDLSEAWSRSMSRRLTSLLLQAQQDLTDLASDGASTQPSPEPQG